MMLNDEQRFALRCFEAQGWRVTTMETESKVYVFICDELLILKEDGSLEVP